MSVRSRWLRKLNTARLWEKIARQRYIWHPTAENRRKLAERRRQVATAECVLKRHPPGKPEPATGIDVSNLQGTVDFKKVRWGGYRFVYVKAGEGDWKDPLYVRNVHAATAVGLEVGAYQFLRPKPGRTGVQEAEMFIARLREAGLGRGDLCPVLDVEATKLDKAGTHAYVRSFVNAMRSHGYRPVIYTGTWFWEPNVGTDDFGCPLWIAAYQNREPALPKPWTEYVCWQFSSSGRVPGIAGDVDLNRTDDLRELIA